MRAGRLRDKAILQEPTSTVDPETGHPTDAWVDVGTMWVDATDLAGRAFFEAAQAQSEVTTPVRARLRPGIKPNMRLIIGDRELIIQSIQRPTNRRDEVLLMCSEENPGT